MPKEFIHSMDHGRYIVPEGETEPRLMDHDAIVLGWSREGMHVGLTIVDTEKDPDGFEAAKWINLDRDGCNRLIRFVRRARDAAYGKDE